ncbi:MAG: hypothetical protein AAF585_09300 [Verrucomicrobiota bacterium]
MSQEAKAIVYETDGWFMALCNDFPGVTGEGKSREECIADLTRKIEASMVSKPVADDPQVAATG